MPVPAQDNPIASPSSFHAQLGRYYGRHLDRERAKLFGTDAKLELYKVLPAGRTLVARLTSGWSAQQYDTFWRVEIVEAKQLDWAIVRAGAEVDIITHIGSQRFRVMFVRQPLLAGHAWMLQLEPIERI
jgi:hypothetical protein